MFINEFNVHHRGDGNIFGRFLVTIDGDQHQFSQLGPVRHSYQKYDVENDTRLVRNRMWQHLMHLVEEHLKQQLVGRG